MRQINASLDEVYGAVMQLAPEVDGLVVRSYPVPPDHVERVDPYPGLQSTTEQARVLREKHGIPFWDAMIGTSMVRGPVEVGLLDAALYHQAQTPDVTVIGRHDIASIGLTAAVLRAGVTPPWAVLTTVASGETTEPRHLPMLDFRCPRSPENLITVRHATERVMPEPWTILESSRSYHALSATTLSWEDIGSFYGRCLLLGPIVDRNYVAHQLIEKCGALRGSARAGEEQPRAILSTFPSDSWDIGPDQAHR